MKYVKTGLAVAALALTCVSAAASANRVVFSDGDFKSSNWTFYGKLKPAITNGWGQNRVLALPGMTNGDAQYFIKVPANYRPELYKYELTFEAQGLQSGVYAAVGESGVTQMQRVALDKNSKKYTMTFDGLPATGKPQLRLHLHLAAGGNTELDNVTITEIRK